jgi:hypothetical protein
MKQRTLGQYALGGDEPGDLNTQLVHVVVKYQECVGNIAENLIRKWRDDVAAVSEELRRQWAEHEGTDMAG